MTRLKLWLSTFWSNLQIDFTYSLFKLRRAQYGDLTFGHDERKREARRERLQRIRLIQTSRGPMHAGLNWETEAGDGV